MKPFVKEIDLVECYRNYKNNFEAFKQEKEKSTYIPTNRIDMIVNPISLVEAVFQDKKVPYMIQHDVIDRITLYDIVNKNYYIFASIVPNRSGDTEYFEFTITDEKYFKYCEKIAKYLVDFRNIKLYVKPAYKKSKNIYSNKLWLNLFASSIVKI